ncbi:MAG: MerR family transcriptional regulator [bacterium]|nr:MerR family transcriptional regulator [bacterium]MBK8128380.1 MerR family transcriptional regulator [bacterium]
MKHDEILTVPRTRSARAPKLYSIGQVHAITGIPKPTIRYWEKEFESYLEPARTTGNQRRYDDKAIADLEKINYLVKVQGYTLEGAKRKLELLRKVDTERPVSNDPMAELARAMSDYLLKKLSRD